MDENENVQEAERTAEHVEEAVTEVSQAAASAPTQAINDVLVNVVGVLEGVKAELKRSNDLAEKSIKPAEHKEEAAVEAAAEPITEVVEPPKPVRHVRRNGRKVKR